MAKVTKKFSPVTIVLETEAEANVVYHMLHLGEALALNQYLAKYEIPHLSTYSAKHGLWLEFRKQWTPTDRKEVGDGE